MVKYYLYDIQNDERVFETNKIVYFNLEDCIFNIESLLGLINIFNYNDYDEVCDVYYQLSNLKPSIEKIFKIIRVEVD